MEIQTTTDMPGAAGHERAEDDCCGGRGSGDEAACCGRHGGMGDKCCGHEGHADHAARETPAGLSMLEGRLVVP